MFAPSGRSAAVISEEHTFERRRQLLQIFASVVRGDRDADEPLAVPVFHRYLDPELFEEATLDLLGIAGRETEGGHLQRLRVREGREPCRGQLVRAFLEQLPTLRLPSVLPQNSIAAGTARYAAGSRVFSQSWWSANPDSR